MIAVYPGHPGRKVLSDKSPNEFGGPAHLELKSFTTVALTNYEWSWYLGERGIRANPLVDSNICFPSHRLFRSSVTLDASL